MRTDLASRRRSGFVHLVALAALAAGALSLNARAAEPPESCGTIKTIEVRGNTRMSADAVRFDLRLRAGDPWDDAKIRSEFRRFWARGFFADLRFARRCEPDGAVLIVDIKERPTIVSVAYEKNKVLNQQQIEDYYKERDFSLTVGTPLDRKRLWRAEALIEELLGQKGYLDAEARAEITETAGTTRAVLFRIKAGGKTRIRKLDFTGNEAFSDRALTKQLELVKAYRWYWPWSKKYLYHPLKYQQDINNVLQFYRDRGYLDADVRPAVVEVRGSGDAPDPEKALRRAEREAERAERKRLRKLERAQARGEVPPSELLQPAPPPEPDLRERKWVYVTVPVVEGPIYTLGDVRIEGNEVFADEALRALVPIQAGEVVRDGFLEIGLTRARALYGKKGYVYAAVTRRFERREGAPIADVVIEVDEDQAYTVRRLEFRGNTETHDVVLRREFNTYEGELLDRTELDISMRKLQQLGFWVPTSEPVLEPVPERPEVDVVITGEEQSRNEIQVGGGYSELEGGFFLASYQTRNFLGRGESLGLQVAVGGRSSRGSISFQEPWFLNRPWTFGFTIFRRRYDFGRVTDISGSLQRLSQTSTGGTISLGRRLGNFSQVQVSYGYQSIEADTLDLTADFAESSTRIGSITPLFVYRNLNDFLRPTKGLELLVIPQIAWDGLGGDTSYFKPRVEVSVYQPIFKRFFVAANAEVGWVRAFGNNDREAGSINGVPRFERFFLGGDTIGPRVFETRTISPVEFRARVDSDGDPVPSGTELVFPVFVGGSKMGLFQFEFGLPIGRTATFATFFDVGGTYNDGEDFTFDTARMSAGVEFRVFLPVFQAPIRLIYGWPIREQEFDRTSRFQFSIGLPF